MKGRALILAAVAAAVLQTGLIGQMIWARAAILNNGQEVILRTGFVDPRDLFRGHYVRLDLAISRLDAGTVEQDEGLEPGDTVWVELEAAENGFWEARAVRAAPPRDGVALRGEMSSDWGDTIAIRFPFDRYFAPELRAKELENLRRERRLGIVLSVTSEGEGAVKGITIDGEVIYDEPLL